MSDVLSFIGQVLYMIPEFLMAEPICYVIGFMLLGFTINIFKQLTSSI